MTTTDPAVPPRPGPVRHRDPLGIIVVAYGAATLLRRNLATMELPGGDVSVVVVDNFSTAENRREVGELARQHDWHLVEMSRNAGFGAGVNAGISAARQLGCRTFLMLNPDAVASREVVAELWAHSVRQPLALISPQLLDGQGRVVFRGSRVDLSTGRIARRAEDSDGDAGAWLTAACLIVHDQMFRRVGGFDEGYFLYWEDVDLSFRARAAGGALVVRHDLAAVHDEGGTHTRPGSRAKSALYYRYNCRNRLVFGARHLDRRGLLRWILCTPGASWQILLRGGRRQLVQSPRPLWAAVSGSVAGILVSLPALRAAGTTASTQLALQDRTAA